MCTHLTDRAVNGEQSEGNRDGVTVAEYCPPQTVRSASTPVGNDVKRRNVRMLTELVMNRIRQLLLAIVGVLKRAMCCFSRRRKLSVGECEVLSAVSVDRYPAGNGRGTTAGHGKNVPEKDWNSWDDSPKTVEEHIERYRETLAQPPSPSEPQPEVDYFQDMTPQISSQPKICIANETEPASDFSRLVAKIDIPVVNELEDWNEGDRSGWDDADETTTKQLIRETRKELRAQRHQNRHQHESSSYA